MVFFIPWRVVADYFGAAHLAIPARADGEAAGGAVDFHFRDIPVRGGRWSSGVRDER